MLLGTGRREDTCTLLLLSEEQRVDPLHLLRGVPNHSISVRPVRDEQRRCVSAAWGCHARLRAGTGETSGGKARLIGPYGEHNKPRACRRRLSSRALPRWHLGPTSDVTIRRMQQLASFSYNPGPKTHISTDSRAGRDSNDSQKPALGTRRANAMTASSVSSIYSSS